MLRKEHFEQMKDGAIICNSGHFDVELDIPALEALSENKRNLRPFLDEFSLSGNRKLFLLAEGRLVNLAAAEGHPASVMDMSFANQALSAEHIVTNASKLDNQVYPVPKDLDAEIARLKLECMNIPIDELTNEQRKSLSSWEMGT